MITFIEKKEAESKREITVLNGLSLNKEVWNDVSPSTIINAF